MSATDNIPTKSSRVHRFLPWIIVVIEFLVILLLIVQIVCPHKKLVSTGGGFTSIYYKYQDPNDTDGGNCYAVIVYMGLPYTVVVPQEKATEIANRSVDVAERENRIREEIKKGSTLSKVLELEKWEKVQ